ncbi:MAG: hypothetical protein K0R58_234 [Ramlibacter sp.]|jgi:hypothetical protein|nr:hypothetical protein [Ramlibacter sp.]
MSVDVENRLRILLATAPQNRRRIETLEISHSAMSQTFYLWSEPYEGEVTTEDGVRTMRSVGFHIEMAGSEGNMDQVNSIVLDITDKTDEFKNELALIPQQTNELVRVVIREYLSDDLTEIESGPAVLQVELVSRRRGAAMITAVSPRYNVTRTGEVYAARRIPMLRAFL